MVTYDSSSSLKKFYIDGSLDRSVSAHGNRNLGSGTQRYGTIGVNCEDSSFNTMDSGNRSTSLYRGYLDELRLYDRALNTDEVDFLFKSASDTDGDGLSDAQEIYGYHTYREIPGTFTWTEAKADAEARGGHLATIASKLESEEVLSASTDSPWIGGTDQVVEGQWKWIDDSDITFSNWEQKQVFSFTGTDQTFVVPDNVRSVEVKIWGAGGGGAPPGHVNNNGGAGGYTTGTLNVMPGETLTLIVGQGGINHSGFPEIRDYRYGGGASGGIGPNYGVSAASGGGRSAIRRGATELATAGGGGGAGYSGDGGNAGGTNGQSGQSSGSTSGTIPGGGSTENGGLGPGGSGGSFGSNGTEYGTSGIQFQGGYSLSDGDNSEADIWQLFQWQW